MPPGCPVIDETPDSFLRRVLADVAEMDQSESGSGGLSVGEEFALDELFLAFAPVTARLMPPAAVARGGSGASDALGAALRQVRRASALETEAPKASNLPGGRWVKTAVARAVSWYVGYLAAQLGRFSETVTRTLEMMARIVDSEERAVSEGEPAMRFRLPAGELDDRQWWLEIALDQLRSGSSGEGARGRVLHLGCGNGSLLRALNVAGLDAYGIDVGMVRQAGLGSADSGDGDVRAGDPIEHLRSVGPGSLAGVVVSGVVEHLTPGELRILPELLAGVLESRGVCLIHSATPEAWATSGGVAADLSPGRPVRPETWTHLLEGTGLTPAVHTGPPLGASTNTGPESTAERVPPDYVIVARNEVRR